MSDTVKPRLFLGERATSIATEIAGINTKLTTKHLEEAILKLEAQAQTNVPQEAGVDREALVEETDQLYRELTVEIRTQGAQMAGRLDKIEGHMEALAKSVDAIRIMLNIFGEELGQADTSELFKEANALMTDVLEPLARERKAPVLEQTKSEDDARGSQREETEEIQQREDPDLEMNGHAVVQETTGQSPTMTKDEGRGT